MAAERHAEEDEGGLSYYVDSIGLPTPAQRQRCGEVMCRGDFSVNENKCAVYEIACKRLRAFESPTSSSSQ